MFVLDTWAFKSYFDTVNLKSNAPKILCMIFEIVGINN